MSFHKMFPLQGELTAEKADAIIAVIKQAQDSIPFLRGLTPEEARHLVKVSDAAWVATQSLSGVAEKHPGAFPPSLPAGDLEKNVETARQLERVAEAARSFEQALSHTARVARSNGYRLALALYRAAQVTASLSAGLAALLAPLRAVLDRPSRKRGE
jgi:hypothetical protein